MSGETTDVRAGFIQKNAREQIVVQWREYEGARYLDVRLFTIGDDAKYRPTKKGITVRTGHFEAFVDLLLAARTVAIENKILDAQRADKAA